jgi:hypothetical protein
MAAIKTVVTTAVGIFVVLGVAGLLLFGMKQLLGLLR